MSTPRVAQLAEASRSKREGCRCDSCHADQPSLSNPQLTGLALPPSYGLAGHFWNANRASEPGLGANECVPSGKWRKSTAFRQFFTA